VNQVIFKNFLRLDATLFDELLKMIMPRIEKRKLVRKELSFLNSLFLSASGYLSIYIFAKQMFVLFFFKNSFIVILALDILQSRYRMIYFDTF
jgi:hypothetical protein